MKIAVYGPRVGYSSFEVVTRGFIEAAEESDLSVGWCATGRQHLPEDGMDWVGADIGILCGDYSKAGVMTMGGHPFKFVMLAPNSTWIPESFYQTIRDFGLAGALVPSKWAKSVVLESAPDWFEHEVLVVPHGISKEHIRVKPSKRNDDKCVFLHMCNSSVERKGTRELLTAFAEWENSRFARLYVVCNPMDVGLLREYSSENVHIISRVNAPPSEVSKLYSNADLVIQPSRAEGFGLVPLEALACGTPVAITLTTGHLEYCLNGLGSPRDGVIPIAHGKMTSVSYDPGGQASSVSVDAVIDAMDRFYLNESYYKEEAESFAEGVRSAWSWASATNPFFNMMLERFKEYGEFPEIADVVATSKIAKGLR